MVLPTTQNELAWQRSHEDCPQGDASPDGASGPGTDAPPTICLFSALYAPSIGGVEGYTQHLAHGLTQLGWRVIVVAMNTHAREGYVHEAPETDEAAAQADVPPTSDNASAQADEPATGSDDRRTTPGTPPVEVVRLPCRPLLDGRYPVPRKNAEYRALWRWLESQPINYVVVNTRFYPLSEEGLRFAQAQGIVPVIIEHGSAHLTMGNPALDVAVEAVEHALTRRVRRYPAAFFGVSKRACGWLGHFGIQASGVLPNAIDADGFAALASAGEASFRKELGLPPDAFVVAFVGRLVPEKGVEQLVEAVKLVRADRPVALLIAGTGPLESALRQQADNSSTASDAVSPAISPNSDSDTGGATGSAGTPTADDHSRNMPEGRVFLLGSLPKPQVAALLQQADALCLPSRSEGFATVLLEASAVGTPAVATAVGGTDELFPTASYGVVIPDAAPETIAGALEAAATDPSPWRAMGARAADRVRTQFTWRNTAEALIAACRKANKR